MTLSRNKVLKLKNSPTVLITSAEYILMANVSQTQDKLRVVEKSYVDVYEKWISFICPGKSVPAVRNHYAQKGFEVVHREDVERYKNAIRIREQFLFEESFQLKWYRSQLNELNKIYESKQRLSEQVDVCRSHLIPLQLQIKERNNSDIIEHILSFL
jgi:hypothetical protein